MTDITLELPDIKYKASFIKAVKEMKANPNNIQPSEKDMATTDIERCETDFENYIVKPAHDWHQGKNLPGGWVPWSNYWMIADGEFVGRVSFRHVLANERLQKYGGHIGYMVLPSKRKKGYAKQALLLALRKAKEKGLDEVLVCCRTINEASKRTIENAMRINGGRLDGVIPNEDGTGETLRYWVKTEKEK